ncbi:UNVERIFIED_CONTAM: hypothetical protein HDU68_004584 [Siphonaria sp. JEL0065]|nr:hypothetical protein HDU68_004584 [Siphonaria sp. JEL0065]
MNPAPPPLPPGFIAQWSAQHNRYFFVNQATGQSQWEAPAVHGGYQAPPHQPPPQQYGQSQPQYGQQPRPQQQGGLGALGGLGGLLSGGALGGALGGVLGGLTGQQPQQQYGQPQQQYGQQPQYGQQQQYHPQQSVSGSFVTQQQITLTLKESYGSFSGDDMQITDNTGRHWFRLDAQTFSMRDKRTLLDANTMQPVVRLEKKFGFGTKWQANGPAGNILFTIEKKTFSFTPEINVFLADGDRDPDFRVTGSFMAKDFQLFDVRGNQNKPVGVCKKERPFNLNAFVSTVLMNKDSYFLTLYPGADVSLWVSVCVLLDEIFHEEK